MSRVVAVLVVALLATGCGVRPSGVIPGLQAPAGREEGTVPTLYFVAGDRVVAVRQVAPSIPGADVIEMLATGPDAAGRGRGLSTQVPHRAAPADVTHNGAGVDVRLRVDVGLLSSFAVDQIVCTVLSQYPGAAWASLHGGSHTVDRRSCPVGR